MTITQGEKALSLTLNANHMAQATLNGEDSIDYYATEGGTPKTVTPGVLTGDNSSYFEIAKVELSGADVGTKYHCQGKYTVSVEVKKASNEEDNIDSDKEQITAEDGKLYLKTTEESGATVSIKEDQGGQPAEAGSNSIDHDIKSLISAGKTFWVTYDFTATESNLKGTLQAAFKMSNRDDDQNYLADKKITVTLTPDTGAGKLTCEIQKDAE